jgi:hypothetical protein
MELNETVSIYLIQGQLVALGLHAARLFSPQSNAIWRNLSVDGKVLIVIERINPTPRQSASPTRPHSPPQC